MPSLQYAAIHDGAKPHPAPEPLQHSTEKASSQKKSSPLKPRSCLRRIGLAMTLGLPLVSGKRLNPMGSHAPHQHLRGSATKPLPFAASPIAVTQNSTAQIPGANETQPLPQFPSHALDQPRFLSATELNPILIKPEDALIESIPTEPLWENPNNYLLDFTNGLNIRALNNTGQLELLKQLASEDQVSAVAIDDDRMACISNHRFIKLFNKNQQGQWALTSKTNIFDAFDTVTFGTFDQITLSGNTLALTGKVSTPIISGILALSAYKIETDGSLTEIGSPNVGNPPESPIGDVSILNNTIAMSNRNNLRLVPIDQTGSDNAPIKSISLSSFGQIREAFYLPERDLALMVSEGRIEVFSLSTLLQTEPAASTQTIEVPNTSKILKATLWDADTVLLLQSHDQLSVLDLNTLTIKKTKNLSYTNKQGYEQIAVLEQDQSKSLLLRASNEDKIATFREHVNKTTLTLPEINATEHQNTSNTDLTTQSRIADLGAKAPHIIAAIVPPVFIGGIQALIKSIQGMQLFLQQNSREDYLNLLNTFLQFEDFQPIDTSTNTLSPVLPARAPALSFANDIAGTAVGSVVAGRYLRILDAGGEVLKSTDKLVQTFTKGLSGLFSSLQNNPLTESLTESVQAEGNRINQIITLAKTGHSAEHIMKAVGFTDSFNTIKAYANQWFSVSEFLVNSETFDLAGLPQNEVGGTINAALQDMLNAFSLITGYTGADGGSVIDEIIVSSLNFAIKNVGNARAEEIFIETLIETFENNLKDTINEITKNPEAFEENIQLIESEVKKTLSNLEQRITAVAQSLNILEKNALDIANSADDPLLTGVITAVGTMLGRYAADAIAPIFHGLARPFALSAMGEALFTPDLVNTGINLGALVVSTVPGTLVALRINQLETTSAGSLKELSNTLKETKQLVTDLREDISSAVDKLSQAQWEPWEKAIEKLTGHQNLVEGIDQYIRQTPKSSADTIAIDPSNLGQHFGYISGRIVDNFLANAEEVKELSEESIQTLRETLTEIVDLLLSFGKKVLIDAQEETLQISKQLIEEFEKQSDDLSNDVDQISSRISSLWDVIGLGMLISAMTLKAIDAMGIRRKLLGLVQSSSQVSEET